MVSLEFFSDIILPVALWSWGRLNLGQKWVPGVFPGGKVGRCVKLTTLPPSCAVVMKSGNLNFLGPSGPLQDFNEAALRIPLCSMDHFSSLSRLRSLCGTNWMLVYYVDTFKASKQLTCNSSLLKWAWERLYCCFASLLSSTDPPTDVIRWSHTHRSSFHMPA